MALTHFEQFVSRLHETMFAHTGNAGVFRESDDVFNDLALDLFELQFTHSPPYRSFCAARGATPGRIGSWTDIPATPAAAFKESDLTCLPTCERAAVFHSSGTSEHRPSRHFHNASSLSIYEDSLLRWFQKCFFPDFELSLTSFPGGALGAQDECDLAILTPPRAQAPHSSLVYMFDTVRRAFGSAESVFLGAVAKEGGWTLELETALATLRRATQTRKPLAVLGTAFSFVHLLDFMVERDLVVQLPPGSRVMETGGYKGRSRVLSKVELHSLIARRLNLPRTHILSEYGMSELSSQAYDGIIGGAGLTPDRSDWSSAATSPPTPHFRFPPWARSRVISAETGQEVADGQTGLIRVFDLANVYSVMAIQTDDLAIRRGDGFELLGRASRAEPRGCSLMASATV